MMGITIHPGTTIALTLLLTISSAANAATYDEQLNGDLSDDRLTPTTLHLDSGDNRVTASTRSDDLEYLTINVPQPFSLTAIMLESYVSTDLIAFAAIQEGTTFTESFENVNPANILGLTHFGLGLQPTVANVGEDLLDNMGAGTFGGMGFDQPLPAGDYTLWLQQIGQAQTTYTLNFIVAMDQPQTVLGDMDDNGTLDAFDVDDFELALADKSAYIAAHPGVDPDERGDLDANNILDAFDVDDFERALAGTSTPAPEPGSLMLLCTAAASACKRRIARA